MTTLQPLQETRSGFVEGLDAPAPSPSVMRIQSRVLEAIARGYSLDDVLSELCFLVEAARKEGLCSILILDGEGAALHPGVGIGDAALSCNSGAWRSAVGVPEASGVAGR